MNSHNGKLTNIVEAMLFAAAEPLSPVEMCRVLEKIQAEEIRAAVAALNQKYTESGGAFRIREIGGGFQLYTLPEYADYIEALLARTRLQRLSVPALETLAVIAYRQPVSTPEIEKVRGVESGGVLRTLLERKLIAIVGRSEGPGRPLLYGTTPEFLYHFGLNNLSELPRLEELEKLLAFREEARQLAIELGPDPLPQETSHLESADHAAPAVPAASESEGESISTSRRGGLVLRRSAAESIPAQEQDIAEPAERELAEPTVRFSPPDGESEEDSAADLLRTASEVVTAPVE